MPANIKSYFIIIALFITQYIHAQVVQMQPQNASVDSTILISYNASLGNAALNNYSGDVYLYTGVISSESNNDTDWKHVITDWGSVSTKTKMTRTETNRYEISFNIRDFYSIGENEQVLKLAMLFVNADYSKIGRASDGKDIYLELTIPQAEMGDYMSYSINDNILDVQTSNGNLQLSYFSPFIIKTEFIETNTSAIDTSFSVIRSRTTEFIPQLDDEETYIRFSSNELDAIVWKNPVKVSYIYNSDTLLHESTGFITYDNGGKIAFTNDLPEYFYGGGSHAIDYERSGKVIRINNEPKWGYGYETSPLNIAIPMVLSSENYALFFDNRFASEISFPEEDSGELIYSNSGGRNRYYFIAGNGFDDVLNSYTNLTGKQELPPIWSLGYIQSKYGYESQTETENLVNDLRAADFPLDALVLDLYWFGDLNQMGKLDWDYTKWPEPSEMMNNFNNEGVKTILITEPYFTKYTDNFNDLSNKSLLSTNSEGAPYIINGFWAGDAGLIDITKEEAQDWMWEFYKARHNEGVGGWWLDLGEPETHPSDMHHEFGSAQSVHNIYSMIWAKMLYENYKEQFSDERLFNLIRSGSAGMQRYSAFPWSGDVQRTFDGLRAQIPIMLSMGMNGFGYMHSDVGGFTGNDYDDELFTRWVQFGVFAPILRLHGVGTTSPLDFELATQNIVRDYINLRYSMLPYNYTLAWENTQYGTPLARPMNYYDPQNNTLAKLNNQYFWGSSFIVAPILERGQTQRNVFFPEGTWINYYNYKRYEGESFYTIKAPIEQIPLFVKAGSIIPKSKAIKTTQHYSNDTLYVDYYPDKSVQNSEYTMFIDNGSSRNTIVENQYELVHFTAEYSSENISLSAESMGPGFTEKPDQRQLVLTVKSIDREPAKVLIDNSEVLVVGQLDNLMEKRNAFFYDDENSELLVTALWPSESISIDIIDITTNNDFSGNNILSDCFINAISPNPFLKSTQIEFYSSKNQHAMIRVFNTDGQVIYKKNRQFNAGMNTTVWEPNNSLTGGVYVIQVSTTSGIYSGKVIKL